MHFKKQTREAEQLYNYINVTTCANKMYFNSSEKGALREKCPNKEFYLVRISLNLD